MWTILHWGLLGFFEFPLSHKLLYLHIIWDMSLNVEILQKAAEHKVVWIVALLEIAAHC